MSTERKLSHRCMVCKTSIDIYTAYWSKVNTIGETKYWHDTCNGEYDNKYAKDDDV
jgi:hypothetical protein